MEKIVFSVSVPEVAFYFLKEQARFFKDNCFDVHIVTSKGTWTTDKDVEAALGVAVHAFPITRVFSFLLDVKTLLKLVLFFRKLRPKYLYATTPKAALLTVLAACLTRISNRIYLIRGLTFINDPPIKKTIMMFFEWFTCRLSHKVLIVSASNLEYVLQHRLCKESKIKLLAHGSSHGVDARNHFNPARKDLRTMLHLRERYCLSPHDLVFGYLGRMVKDKGVEVLIDAWKLYTKKNTTSHLILIGPLDVPRDSISKEYYDYIRQHDRIHLIGDVRDPFDLYSIMDVFVFPSLREGFPNAVLEASALEIPVITTDALGCVDSIIPDKTGLLVPVNNSIRLSEAMESLSYDNDKRCQLGKNGREWVLQKFDPDVIAQTVFKEVVG